MKNLNAIVTDINKEVGEEILGEFFTPVFLDTGIWYSALRISAGVNIDFKEAKGCHAKKLVVGRAIRACDEIINLLKNSKVKLEEIYNAI